MPRTENPAIKSAFSTARDVAALKAARRRAISPPEWAPGGEEQIRGNRKEIQTLFASSLTQSDFDLERFQQLPAQRHTALDQIAERQKADTVAQSPSILASIRQGIANRRKSLDALVSNPVSPFSELLELPFLIWPSQGMMLDASNYEAGNSWAKVRVEASRVRFGYEEVSFYLSLGQ